MRWRRAAIRSPKSILPRLRLGYNEVQDENLIIFVEIIPADVVGNLNVRIQIERVRTSFKTNYPELERFVRELLEVMNDVPDVSLYLRRRWPGRVTRTACYSR